ncbi:BZ3500_MvSof-1268-A1-R1_Chr8-2g10180 [Microbotryum saponariae]|uniref:BZ3500_MvSof-1268-A1-R1_Chr8-2g10180 protein n=1 Tax=Microbotryum saponariae TaxID=289078 RepID=A0A2X0KVJ2_9BASI|nr:BZ3500_MvSof-1268-A1-R1_Chr8-2g10180 [Microbotryum saponariae]SDA01946.1 BZ3501_MvSof-1269-A2-R1_Chr8-2g09930 [Microbotryum saponariae]
MNGALAANETPKPTLSTSKATKTQFKRLKRKAKAKAKAAAAAGPTPDTTGAVDEQIKEESVAPESTTMTLSDHDNNNDDDSKHSNMAVEPLPELLAPEFAHIFAHFNPVDPEQDEDSKTTGLPGQDGTKGEIIYSDDEMPSDDEVDANGDPIVAKPLSKRKQRKMNRLSVAELKRIVKKPEVVDWVDVSATDPKLLVQIKSHRNTIPVPGHWAQKRDYLQGKRGIEKPAFQLPTFIADTGIATQRDAIKEKEEGQSLKQKTRERVQPKMGKIDIDYQKLHDAFFKFQTKPPMTAFGETYYEGKEYETKLKEKKPGDLSDALKEALSIPPLAPPPWLISMQRYGPPPSYPNLRIPGLNAPIPEGAAWGFHPGGWGKPPLDEFGRPLYGDIYGVLDQNQQDQGVPVEKDIWGELEPDEEDSEEEEDENEDEDEAEGEREGAQAAPADGLQTPSGLETPSGFASVTSTVPGGLDTPAFLDLRKQREQTEDDDGRPKSLYQVIPEREARMRGVMGSDRVYDVSGLGAGGPPVLGQEDRGTKRKAGGVDIALDAAELEGLSESDLRQRYEESNRRSTTGQHEDFSDFVGKEVAKRRKTADAKKRGGGGNEGKDKDKFKF